MITRRTFVQSSLAAAASAAVLPRAFAADAPPLSDEERKRREERSSQQVAEQLAAVYGHSLKSLSYIPSLGVVGRARFAQLTGDKATLAECQTLANELLSRLETREIKPGPEGAGLLLFANPWQLPAADADRSRDVLVRFASQALDGSGRPKEAMPGHNEMSDAVFMSCPLLAAVGKLTGQEVYFDACEKHFDFMRKLCEREDGIYRHSPLCEAAWGRGNGFPALGLTMSLEFLPKEHPAHAKFHAAANKLLDALQKHADPMIHQVVDHPESYREFSSTAMCSLAAMLLDKNLLTGASADSPRARWVADAWAELKRRTSENGELVDVCESTGKQKTLDDYFKRKANKGRDDRGGAFALLLATQRMAQGL